MNKLFFILVSLILFSCPSSEDSGDSQTTTCINYKNFVSYRFQNMDRPDFTKNLIDILGAIAELDYKHKS